MFATMSLVTSIKDYIEVVHKLIETDPNFQITTYSDFGSILTFILLAGKELLYQIFSFQWLNAIWSIPTKIPDIASAMISEISIFDGYLQNTQILLENPISYGNNNFFIYCSEKFIIGFINSLFLAFPTSIAHIITLRRFVMQGLEAGFISGLGTIAGNIVWIGSIVFGFRFLVIPWLSFDVFRSFLGFLLIVKYMWDSYTERRMVLEDLSKYKIFFLTFLLSFTEQTTIYPFLSNLSIGSESTILESFPTENFAEFGFVHICYLLGIFVGSLSLLQFTCWFWENPAFQIYMWFISSFKTTPSFYSKFVNFLFLYLTMICAISNIAYFGLDSTLTNPLGFVHEDRLLEQKDLLETNFLNTKASDRNTRRNRGRHGRRERWKRRVRRYRTFDASLYDQGIYDLLTIEDLNYGFDRFWLRRKIRNHRVRFRFFPGPWMRTFKKQLSRPRLESFMGPRVEFFRILFEQAYHPEFHEFSTKKNISNSSLASFPPIGTGVKGQEASEKKNQILSQSSTKDFSLPFFGNIENEKTQVKNEHSLKTSKNGNLQSIYWNPIGNKQERLFKEQSTFRKFLRKINTRIQIAKIQNQIKTRKNLKNTLENSKNFNQPIFSKAWKSFSVVETGDFNFRNLSSKKNRVQKNDLAFFKKSKQNYLFQRFYKKIFLQQEKKKKVFGVEMPHQFPTLSQKNTLLSFSSGENQKTSEKEFQTLFSKKKRFLERYKMFLLKPAINNQKTQIEIPQKNKNIEKSVILPMTSTSSLKNVENSLSLFKSTLNNEKKANIYDLQNESVFRSMTLLHPLNFYFQKEQALKRKYKFYGVKLFRNFGIEKNAPYFRIMMKRFFYHYKPTLRWERTLRVATMRRARRKSSRIPRKFNISKNSQILHTNTNFSLLEKSSNLSETQKKEKKAEFNESFLKKPSHFYSLVEKRASRYRSQIYKDVLQHWYYSPLNRFLLKVDIDSFIRRQPKSYFLTKSDEKLLHLKRQLLSQYYETFRWYTSMQHYSTMKNQIGGTKSLSSRIYNQQFVGTFKKIRHLFNITPNFKNTNVLKFDQPLFNEFQNNSFSILNRSNVHEELLADEFFPNEWVAKKGVEANEKKLENNFQLDTTIPIPEGKEKRNSKFQRLPEDFTNQSATILRQYLSLANPIRQNYIQSLLFEKNYWELTKFLFRGQKVRGTNPVTNETDFLNQEKTYLMSEKIEIPTIETQKFQEKMWIALLKKCQKKLYDQEALKNYVALKKEKYENKKQKHEKYLKNRLERMKESLIFLSPKANQKIQNFKTKKSEKNSSLQFENFYGYTSSVRKAMKESILWKRNSISSSSFQTVEKFFAKKIFFQKTNIRKNRPNFSFFKTKNKIESSAKNHSIFSNQINPQKMQSLVLPINLKNSMKKQAFEILEAENSLKKNFSLIQSKNQSKISNLLSIQTLKNFFSNTLRLNKRKEKNQQRISFSQIFEKFPFVSNIVSIGKYGTYEISKKNFHFWKKRENALSKRKKIRKTFKKLRNQNNSFEKIGFENFSKQNPLKNTRPSRQKSEKNTEDNQDSFFSFFPGAGQKQQKTRSESWKKFSSFQPNKTRNFGEKVDEKQTKLESERRVAKPKSFFFSLFSKGMVENKGFFKKDFLRKRSRLRRYSSFKGRGPIKKRSLREKLKRQFKSLKKYGATQENSQTHQTQNERENKKFEFIQLITQKSSFLRKDQNFLKRDQKLRRTRQMKHRAWKKKKQNFAQKRRKLRKRRRSTISKIRVFNKKLQRILSKKQIQTWWWQTFFPTFQKTTEKNWQIQKNMQIRKELFDLSEKEILEREKFTEKGSPLSEKQIESENSKFFENNENQQKNFENSVNILQIGDIDYKPLAIPEALRIREKLVQNQILNFSPTSPIFREGKTAREKMENKEGMLEKDGFFQKEGMAEKALDQSNESSLEKFNILKASPSEESKFPNLSGSYSISTQNSKKNFNSFDSQKHSDFFEKFTEILSINQTPFFNSLQKQKYILGTNPIPFYAGWDESLRKFVITNRLFSRKDCFSFSSKGRDNFFNSQKNGKIVATTPQEYLKAPLQGMNAATTLYWQIPFTTYDPDQFFALGMDGFSPLGWRNFSFKHSKQTTKPILVKNFFSFQKNENLFSTNLQFKILENALQTKIFDPKICNTIQNCLNMNEFEKINHIGFSQDFQKKNLSNTEIEKNFEYRRILKKQKRIKKHPRPPVWFPSGALSQQVLPVHYIYVFYKRSRFPRDRYIRRRLRSTFFKNQKSTENFSKSTVFSKITDFTLRKRVKPRRKYHRKRFLLETNQFLRRRKFRSFLDENQTSRPSSKIFDISSKQEKRSIKSKQRRKIPDPKQPNENLRVRQLRRRVQRQVFRPIWRYRPRSGGFVWPGDYLRLELVKAPLLNSPTVSTIHTEKNENPQQETASRKIRKKKRRTLQEWQIQPKKYLIEKHNKKVLKKRFEKSFQFFEF